MRVLHIIKKGPPGPHLPHNIWQIITAHMEAHETEVVELAPGFDAVALLEKVEKADKIFCW